MIEPRLPVQPHEHVADGSKSSAYQVLVYEPARDFDGGGYLRHGEARYTIQGDTLTLVELQGSDTLAIAFGDSGKFVPVHEGDTLTRNFDVVRIRDTSYPVIDASTGYGQTARAIFLVSFGRTLDRRFRPSGFVAGFPIARGAATTVGIDAFSVLPAGFSNGGPIGNPMRFGGSVTIQNNDPSQPLYLYNGPPGAFDATDNVASLFRPGTAWIVPAGGTLSIDADSALRRSNSEPAISGSHVVTLCVAAAAGSVDFGLMLSRPALNISDWESDAGTFRTFDVGGA